MCTRLFLNWAFITCVHAISKRVHAMDSHTAMQGHNIGPRAKPKAKAQGPRDKIEVRVGLWHKFA